MTRQDGPSGLDHPELPVLVGVDVGGTKILAARVCTRTGEPSGPVQRPTPSPRLGSPALEDAIAGAVMDAGAGLRVTAVGLGVAGFVDADREKVRFAPHLAWRDRDVKAVLGDRLGVPVELDNDASCAALAESRYGAGRGSRSMVMVTVGTGIGGGVVIDGRLFRGVNGMAGEFGHTRVAPDGLACPCGLSGCWEQYCSGAALQRFARAAMASRSSLLTDLAHGDPDAVTGPMVTRAAQAGDAAALEAFTSLGEWLGVGIANLVASLDPEVVVVGGGVAAAGDLLLEPARRSLESHLVGARHRSLPPVVPAELGPAACVVGAAVLASERA